MKIPFGTGHYKGRSSNANAQECVNFFAEMDENGKFIQRLIGTPGLSDLGTVFADTEIRAALVFNSLLYVVAGGKLYEVDTDYAPTELGSLNTTTGYCEIHDDGDYVVVCDGTDAYSYQTSTATFAEITDTDMIGAQSMTFQDGYHITCFEQKFQISGLLNPTTYDALDYTTAQGQSDDLVKVLSNNRELWAFGTKSTEVYYNTGAAAFPFERIPGAFLMHGILGRGAACLADNTIYWLNHDRWLMRADAYSGIKITPPGVDYHWESYPTVSDATMYSYVEEGHTFIVITFPTEAQTWVYDISTNHFHKRQSYTSAGALSGRHRSNCYAWFNNKHVIGDFEDGKLKAMDLDTYDDCGESIRRVNVFPVMADNDSRARLIHHKVEIEFEAGVGLTGGVQGEDPKAVLDWSDDGGHTWGNDLWASVGKIGEYEVLAQWHRLGVSRSRNYRLVVTDPVKWVVVSAYGEIEKTRY